MDGLQELPHDLLDILGDQDTDNSLDQLFLEWGSSEEEQCHPRGEAATSGDCLIELEELNQLARPPGQLQPHAVTSSMGSYRGGAGAGAALYASHPPPHPGAAAAGPTDFSWDVELFPELLQSYGNSLPLASPSEPELQQQVLPIHQPVHQQQQQQQPWVANNQQPLHLLGAIDFDQQQLQSGAGDQQPPGHLDTPQLDVTWLPGPGPATSQGWVPVQDMQVPCTAAAGGAAAPPVPPYAEAAAAGEGGGLLWSAGGYQTATAGLVTVPSDASSNTMIAGGWQWPGGQPLLNSTLDLSLAAAALGKGGVFATAGAGWGIHGGASQHAHSASLQEKFNRLRQRLCSGAGTALRKKNKEDGEDVCTQTARVVVDLSVAADAAGVFNTEGDHATRDPLTGRNLEHFEQLIAAGLLDISSVGYWAYMDGRHPHLHTSGNPSISAAALPDTATLANPHLTSSSSSAGSGGSGGVGYGMGSAYAMVVSATRCNPRGTTSAVCNTRRRDISRDANVLRALTLAVRIIGPGVPTAADGTPAWFQLYGWSATEKSKSVGRKGAKWRYSVMAPAVQVQEDTGLPIPLPAPEVTAAANGSFDIRLQPAGGQPQHLEGLPELLHWAVFDPSKPFHPKQSRKGGPNPAFKYTQLLVMRDAPHLDPPHEGDKKRKAAAGTAAAGEPVWQSGQAAAAAAAAACTSEAGATNSNRAAYQIMSPPVGCTTDNCINHNMTTMYSSSSSRQQTFMELLQEASEDAGDVAAQQAAMQLPGEASNQHGSAHCARKRARKTSTMYHNQQSG